MENQLEKNIGNFHGNLSTIYSMCTLRGPQNPPKRLRGSYWGLILMKLEPRSEHRTT